MVAKRTNIKLDKKDHLRALLTDTAPSDVPIIFSNDGFYINMQRAKLSDNSPLTEKIELLISTVINPKNRNTQSNPHKYKIIKNDVSLRTLSLLHPRAQNNIVNFYAEWSESIAYLCSLSPISIRAPVKVGNSFYSKNSSSLNNKYKEISIDTLESELVNKHASSYFSYRGVKRIYEIFSQQRYIELEKQFPIMWLMDVTNCFPSIYTHSISWAVKNKEYIKRHVKFSNQFCQTFDTLMQRCNNNETNGIPVGSEVSRIFAEIILQSIDLQIIESLENNYSLKLGLDYSILRYVDDYIIFSKNKASMGFVSGTISDTLSNYNLYINDSKLKKYSRPFCTDKSNTIIGLDEVINDLEYNLFEVVKTNGQSLFFAKNIYNRHKFTHALINKVKRICSLNSNGYSDVSAYLISVCYFRIERLIDSSKRYTTKQFVAYSLDTRMAISILMEIMFFFYSVYPTIPASNKLSKSIIIVDGFIKDKLPQYLPFIRTEVMDNINQLSLDRTNKDRREGYISLERLNILLATSDFGSNYLVPIKYFNSLLKNTDTLSYFNIVSLLYYFKSHSEYIYLVKELENIITKKFKDGLDLQKNSENAHLVLDLLSCPYVSREFRIELLKNFNSECHHCSLQSDEELEEDIILLSKTYWFVKWNNLDLLNQLERKELKSVY
jgi:hypothetical protein